VIRLRDTLALKDFMTDMSMMVSTWQTDEGVSPRPVVTTIDNNSNSNSNVNSAFPSQGSLKDYLDNAKSLGHEIDAIGNIQKAVYHYTHSINSTSNDETDALLDYDKVRLGSYGSLFEYYEDPSDIGLGQQHDRHHNHNHHNSSNSNSNSGSSNDVYSTWMDTNTSDVIIDIHDNSGGDDNDDTWRTIHAATATATATTTATIDSSATATATATTGTAEEKYSDASDDTTWMSSSPDINTMLNNDANNFDNNIDDGDDDGGDSGNGNDDEGGFSFKTVSSDSSNKVNSISSYNNYDNNDDNDNDDDDDDNEDEDDDEVNVDDIDNDDDSIDKNDSTDDNGDDDKDGNGDISVTYRIVHYDVDGDTNDDNNYSSGDDDDDDNNNDNDNNDNNDNDNNNVNSNVDNNDDNDGSI